MIFTKKPDTIDAIQFHGTYESMNEIYRFFIKHELQYLPRAEFFMRPGSDKLCIRDLLNGLVTEIPSGRWIYWDDADHRFMYMPEELLHKLYNSIEQMSSLE